MYRTTSRVAILLTKEWKNKIQSYSYVNDTIVTTKLKIDKGTWEYDPEEEKKKEPEKFYEKLQNHYLAVSGVFQRWFGWLQI